MMKNIRFIALSTVLIGAHGDAVGSDVLGASNSMLLALNSLMHWRHSKILNQLSDRRNSVDEDHDKTPIQKLVVKAQCDHVLDTIKQDSTNIRDLAKVDLFFRAWSTACDLALPGTGKVVLNSLEFGVITLPNFIKITEQNDRINRAQQQIKQIHTVKEAQEFLEQQASHKILDKINDSAQTASLGFTPSIFAEKDSLQYLQELRALQGSANRLREDNRPSLNVQMLSAKDIQKMKQVFEQYSAEHAIRNNRVAAMDALNRRNIQSEKEGKPKLPKELVAQVGGFLKVQKTVEPSQLDKALDRRFNVGKLPESFYTSRGLTPK